MGDVLITKPGIYADISNQDYHADFCPSPSLSSSIAKVVARRSVAHGWTKHPRCPWFEAETKNEWNLGSAWHALLLDPENAAKQLRVLDPKNYRGKQGGIPKGFTNDAIRAARDEAYEMGLTPVLPEQLAAVKQFVEATRAQLAIHETDSDAFTDGKPELSFVWQDIGGVWCRARPDWTPDDIGRFWDDAKSTETSTHPATIGRWSSDQGHAFQAAWYRRGVKALTGENVKWRFVAVENSPPYGMCVFEISPEAAARADQQCELAIRLWADALESEKWPCYPLRRVVVEPPPWEGIQWDERVQRAKFEGAEKTDPVLARMINDGLGG